MGKFNTKGSIIAGTSKKVPAVNPELARAAELVKEDYGIVQALFEELFELVGMNKWAVRDAKKAVEGLFTHHSPERLFNDLKSFGKKHGKGLIDPILDIVGFGLDIIGIFEPTPVADILSGSLSAFRGNYLDAGLSWVGVIPYVGDLGKFGKFAKNKTLQKMIKKSGDGNIMKFGSKIYKRAQSKVAAAAKAKKEAQALLDKAVEKAAQKVKKEAKAALDKATAKAKKEADKLKKKLDEKNPPKDKPKKSTQDDGANVKGKKRTKKQKKGDCAEHLAKQYLKEQGIDVIEDSVMDEVGDMVKAELSAVLTNGSGHGIDFLGVDSKGKLIVGELKANTSKASKLQQLGGPKYLEKQLAKMEIGIENGTGNFKAFKDNPEKKKAFKEIQAKVKKGNTDYKFIKVELEDDPTGEYDIAKGGCKGKKGKAPVEKDWSDPITGSGNKR